MGKVRKEEPEIVEDETPVQTAEEMEVSEPETLKKFSKFEKGK